MSFVADAKTALRESDDPWCVLVHSSGDVLVRAAQDGGAALPRRSEVAVDTYGAVIVGSFEARPIVAKYVDAAPDGTEPVGLRPLYMRVAQWQFEATMLATQLLHFAKEYQHCPACTGALAWREGTRARVCIVCKREHWPRVSPCTITLVHDGDRVLLTRQSRYPAGMYGLVAGFVEVSESLEQCVHRELREETGLTATELKYFGSQPWPFPHQLMLGFSGKYAGGELVVDHDELEEARWFHRDAMPSLPPGLSIARRLIEAWLARALLRFQNVMLLAHAGESLDRLVDLLEGVLR